MQIERTNTGTTDIARVIRHREMSRSYLHDMAFDSLAESLLAEEIGDPEEREAAKVLAELCEEFRPGTPEYDAVQAALGRGYVPGTHQFNEFFAWSVRMLMSVSH